MGLSQRQELLAALAEHGCVTFDNKVSYGRWNDTINELVKEGIVTTHLLDCDEQSSVIEVRAVKGRGYINAERLDGDGNRE